MDFLSDFLLAAVGPVYKTVFGSAMKEKPSSHTIHFDSLTPIQVRDDIQAVAHLSYPPTNWNKSFHYVVPGFLDTKKIAKKVKKIAKKLEDNKQVDGMVHETPFTPEELKMTLIDSQSYSDSEIRGDPDLLDDMYRFVSELLKYGNGFGAELLVLHWNGWKKRNIQVFLLEGGLSNSDALLVWPDRSTIVAEIKYVPYGTFKRKKDQKKFTDFGPEYLTVPVKVNEHFHDWTSRTGWCLILVIGDTKGLSLHVWIPSQDGIRIPSGECDHVGILRTQLIHIGDVDDSLGEIDIVSKSLCYAIHQHTRNAVHLLSLEDSGFAGPHTSGFQQNILDPSQQVWCDSVPPSTRADDLHDLPEYDDGNWLDFGGSVPTSTHGHHYQFSLREAAAGGGGPVQPSTAPDDDNSSWLAALSDGDEFRMGKSEKLSPPCSVFVKISQKGLYGRRRNRCHRRRQMSYVGV